jgi:alpha-1,2-mannosyltransferase
MGREALVAVLFGEEPKSGLTAVKVVENSTRAELPDWLFDERRERMAWAVWGIIFSLFTIVSILRPGMREVLHVYRDASVAWLSGQEIYPGIDYPPTFVILFTPFAKMPVAVSEILWRALGMGVYVSSLWRLARAVEPGPRKLFFLVSILSLQAALGSIKNGQTNLLLAGAMAHASIDWMAGRRRVAAIWLIVATVAKPIAIVMVLLLAAADITLAPWLAGGLLLAGSMPLIFDPWPSVAHQYRAWYADILSIASSEENRFDDLNGLFRTLHVHVPVTWMVPLRGLAAAFTLLVWLVLSRRMVHPERALMLLSLSAAYLMLFNPRTESNSYVILSTAIAPLAALILVVQGRKLGWLLVGLEVAMWNGSFGKQIWLMTKLWLMPVVAVVFFAVLISEAWRWRPRNSREATATTA